MGLIDWGRSKLISRKLLVWVVGSIFCYIGKLPPDQWVTLSMVYLGSQAILDGLKAKG